MTHCWRQCTENPSDSSAECCVHTHDSLPIWHIFIRHSFRKPLLVAATSRVAQLGNFRVERRHLLWFMSPTYKLKAKT
eukprot:5325702-Amphidinium_carterae.1